MCAAHAEPSKACLTKAHQTRLASSASNAVTGGIAATTQSHNTGKQDLFGLTLQESALS